MAAQVTPNAPMRHLTSVCFALLLLLASACQTALEHRTGSVGSGYVAQGILGVTDMQHIGFELESSFGEALDADESKFPMFGGAWQVPMREGPLGTDLGFEIGFTWAAKWDSSDVIVDTGTVIVAADNDYTLVDVFAGPFLATELGRDVRLYGSAGPMLQWGRVELTFDDVVGAPEDVDEEGMGVGLYARAGLELYMGRDAWFGIGARWTDSTVVFDDTVEEVDFDGLQLFATLTFEY